MLKRTFALTLLAQFMLSGCVAPVVVAAAGASAGTANVAGSSRSLSTQVDDVKIEADIDTILNRHTTQLKDATVEHTTFNGIVLLLGQVPTSKLKAQIAAQVSQVKGVVTVYNQMTVGHGAALGKFTKDIWLTTKVKTQLTGPVNSLHFKVVTENAVVYLMGRVTPDEGEQAVKIAEGVKGVKKVVRIFSYVYPQKGPAEAEIASPDGADNAAVPDSRASNNASDVGPDASD